MVDKKNKISELRKKRNKTQAQLAEEIGVTKLTISRWENGERIPKADKAQVLADYFGVTTAYLLGLVPKEEAHRDEILFSDGKGGVTSFSEARNQEILEEYFKSREEDFIKVFRKHGIVISDKEIDGILKLLSYMSINTYKSPLFSEVLNHHNPEKFLKAIGYAKLCEAFNSQPVEDFKKNNGYDTEHI